MSTPPDILRIEGDLAFQRRVWVAERAGWLGMCAFVLAATLGAFGAGGPLADATTGAGGVEVAWPRTARLGRADPIRVTLPPGDEVAELRLSPEFPAQWRLHDATPPPVASVAGADATVLRFARGADGTARIALHVEPIGGAGPRRLGLAAGGQRFDLPVFVWP